MDVVVFMDWQNIYKRAREVFHSKDDPDYTSGQVHPAATAWRLAELSAGGAPPADGSPVNLSEVRIYRGQPDQAHDQKGFNAYRRQSAAWTSSSNRIVITSRLLRGYSRFIESEDGGYWTEHNPREKGIDAALAIDLVVMAVEEKFDRAIVFSGDHDIAPALEYAIDYGRRNHRPSPIVQVAAWKPDPPRHGSRLNLRQGYSVFCNWLDRNEYNRLIDPRDYACAPPPATGGPRPGPR